MDEQKHVILSTRMYKTILNYLSRQAYGDVVQLVPAIVNDVEENGKNLSLTTKEKPIVESEVEPYTED